MKKWTVVLVAILAVVLAVSGTHGKEPTMAAGDNWMTYGQPLGYSQEAWNALSQVQRDAIKARAIPTTGGALINQGYASLAALPTTTTDTTAMDTTTDPYATDGTGSSSGGTALEAPKLLAESPEWLAYLNALNFEESQFRSDIDKQKALYTSESERQLTDLPAGYQSQRRGISGSMESRGMSRSGEFLRRLAENRAQQGRAEGAIKGQLAFQTGSLESQLAQKLLDINARKAQQELQMRGQGYV